MLRQHKQRDLWFPHAAGMSLVLEGGGGSSQRAVQCPFPEQNTSDFQAHTCSPILYLPKIKPWNKTKETLKGNALRYACLQNWSLLQSAFSVPEQGGEIRPWLTDGWTIKVPLGAGEMALLCR